MRQIRNTSRVLWRKRGGNVGITLAAIAAVNLLTGCTPFNMPISIPTQKVAEVISVSDERDMVTMGSPYLYLEKPDVDWARAREDAVAYCLDWKGLSRVEPVGTTRRECLSWVSGDCVRYAIVGDYQCVK